MNFLDDSIKSQEDIETYLKLPFLGYVPNIKTSSIMNGTCRLICIHNLIRLKRSELLELHLTFRAFR